MASDDKILKFYDLENVESGENELGYYGEVDKFSGDFIFKECDGCKGPLYAHKKCLGKEKTLHWSPEQNNLILASIKENHIFKAALAKHDKRITASTCNVCEKRLANQSALETHLNIVHKVQSSGSFNMTEKMHLQDELKRVKTQIPNHHQQRQSPQILMKTPDIAIWIKPMEYEYYKSQVEA